jgi:ATP-dependent Clp protease ATP-binding subunit ClpB
VVLFDEIEKAHPDVFNVLLQVLDDGRLTDGQGRTVDFRNTVIIMTSNIGSSLIQEHFADDKSTDDTLHEGVMSQLKQHFRPEFLNRVDDSIIFRSLDESELGAIVDIQLDRVGSRLQDQQLTLAMDKSARAFLAKEGYDPQFGARPLKRAIQKHLLDPLALRLLDGDFKPGDSISAQAKADQVELSLVE